MGLVSYWKKPCTQGPRAANDSGPRKAKEIRLCVIHSAEASDDVGEDRSAEGVASFFSRKSTKASTHLVADKDSCVRMLPDLVIPWGATGANHDGLHIEICGRAGWNRQQWTNRPTMLKRAAAKVAMWCWQYKIPVRWLTVTQVERGVAKGLTTHVDVNRAFMGGSHWDPGPNFPKDLFLQWVKDYYAQIEKARAKK